MLNEQALNFHRFLVQKSSKNRWKIKHILIKIWTLFFDPNFVRFWTPLGTILGAWGDHFGHIWPPKSATHRGKDRCWSLLDSLLVPLRGQDQILLNFWTHLGPKWLQNGSQRRVLGLLRRQHCSKMGPSGAFFGFTYYRLAQSICWIKNHLVLMKFGTQQWPTKY